MGWTQGGGGGWAGTLSVARSRKMYEAARLMGETSKAFINQAIDERIARLEEEPVEEPVEKNAPRKKRQSPGGGGILIPTEDAPRRDQFGY